MKEVRAKTQPVAEMVSYKIRTGELTTEGGDKIWRFAMQHHEMVDVILDILDMELPEADTIMRIERLA